MDKPFKIQRNSKKCSIPTCGKSYRSDADIQLFTFPEPNTAMGKIWRSRCGFPSDSTKLVLCQNHFVPGSYGKRYLRKNALPTLNLGDPINCYAEQTTKVDVGENQVDQQDKNGDGTSSMNEYIKQEIEATIENSPSNDDECTAESWAEEYENNHSYESSENNYEPQAKRLRVHRDQPEASEFINVNLTNREALQSALHCMKNLLSENMQKDEFTVFVEHIAHKLRTCKRDSIEIKVAQHHIENIIYNLGMGVYSQTQPVGDPLAVSSSDLLHLQPNSSVPNIQSAVINIIPKVEPSE